MEATFDIARGKRRAFAQRFLPSFIKEGYTTTEGLNVLKDWGIGYRRTDFLSDWRTILGRPARTDVLKYVPKKYRPPGHMVTPTPEYLSKTFRAEFVVRGTDALTGEAVDVERWLAIDELAPIRDLENRMISILSAKVEVYKIDIDKLFLADVKTRMTPL